MPQTETPLPANSATPTPDLNEKVKETKTLKGIFRGFESVAAYRKASIELPGEDYGGEEGYPLNNDPALLYFLAANLDKPLEFTYQMLERMGTQRGSGTGEIEKLVAAKDEKGLAQDVWWQQQKAANPDEAALRKKFDALVAQATMKEDEDK